MQRRKFTARAQAMKDCLTVLRILVACAPTKTPTWPCLFDGASLNGWKGDPAVWRVENGYISGKAGQFAAQALQAVRQNNWNKVVIEVEG
jgi:hypothetical protein